MLLAGLLLGLSLASPAGAAPRPGPAGGRSRDQADPVSAPIRPDATSTTSSTTSTSTTSSTSTTTATTTPPVTSPVTSEIAEPLVVTNDPPVVANALPARRTSARSTARAAAPTGPELPFTGSGTFGVFIAGLAALAMGALALWWGSRTRDVDPQRSGTTG